MASPSTDAPLELWLADLRANDLAFGTVWRYNSAIESILAWSEGVCHFLEGASKVRKDSCDKHFFRK